MSFVRESGGTYEPAPNPDLGPNYVTWTDGSITHISIPDNHVAGFPFEAVQTGATRQPEQPVTAPSVYRMPQVTVTNTREHTCCTSQVLPTTPTVAEATAPEPANGFAVLAVALMGAVVLWNRSVRARQRVADMTTHSATYSAGIPEAQSMPLNSGFAYGVRSGFHSVWVSSLLAQSSGHGEMLEGHPAATTTSGHPSGIQGMQRMPHFETEGWHE